MQIGKISHRVALITGVLLAGMLVLYLNIAASETAVGPTFRDEFTPSKEEQSQQSAVPASVTTAPHRVGVPTGIRLCVQDRHGNRIASAVVVTDTGHGLITNSEGLVSITDLDTLQARVSHPEFLATTHAIAHNDRETGSATVILEEACSLMGTVSDGGNVFLPNATLLIRATRPGFLVTNSQEASMSTITDDTGRFIMHGLPPGEYILLVRRKGYVLANKDNMNQTLDAIRLDLSARRQEILVRMSRLYCSVIVLRGASDFTREYISMCTSVSVAYPEGITDLSPSLRQIKELREELIETFASELGCVVLNLGRATDASLNHDRVEAPVGITIMGKFAREVKVPWVAVDVWSKPLASVLEIDNLPRPNEIEVDVSFDCRLVSRNLKRHHFAPFATEGSRQRFLVPAGDYYVRPRVSELVIPATRNRLIMVVDGTNASVSMPDYGQLSKLRVDVSDERGKVVEDYSLRIAAKHGEVFFYASPGNPFVELDCSPGEYTISVRDRLRRVKKEEKVEVIPGNSKQVMLVLSGI